MSLVLLLGEWKVSGEGTQWAVRVQWLLAGGNDHVEQVPTAGCMRTLHTSKKGEKS